MPSPSKDLADLSSRRRPVLADITVVIPTLGRAILQESLCWIASGSAWPAQIIVVDQGKKAQVAHWMDVLREIGIDAMYVPSSERGRASGINRGLERVQTCFVAVTDDDCFVQEDWLENMVARLQDHPEAIVTGRVEAAGDEAVAVVVTSLKPVMYRRPRLKFDALSGGNVGTSMAVVRRVGFFDEDPRLRTAEDGEWAYRALRAGIPILYAPEVVVRHYGWRDEGQRSVQYKDYARSHGGFYGKYLRKGDWFIAMRALAHHTRALRRWIGGMLTGNEEQARYGRAYFTGLLPGMINGMRRKGS